MSKKIKDLNKFKQSKRNEFKEIKEQISEERCPICDVVDGTWEMLFKAKDKEEFKSMLHTLLYEMHKRGIIDNIAENMEASNEYLKFLLENE